MVGRAERGHWQRNPGKSFGDSQGMLPGSKLFLSESFLSKVRTNCSSLVNACLWVGAGISVPVGFNLVHKPKLPAVSVSQKTKGLALPILFSRPNAQALEGGWRPRAPSSHEGVGAQTGGVHVQKSLFTPMQGASRKEKQEQPVKKLKLKTSLTTEGN